MTGLTIDADISPDVDLFGKTVTNLQDEVSVSGTNISGTLHYVTGYTKFSSIPEEQQGNYLAIHCAVPGVDGVTIGVEVIGGSGNVSTLDADGLIVLLIKNTSQKVKVTASKSGLDSVSKTYSLTGLTLESNE